MRVLSIHGGQKLRGEYPVHGAKNSVLPILAATILCGGECVIHNCPNLMDVDSSIRILKQLGCEARREGSTVVVNTRDMNQWEIPDSLMREMRSSVVFLGAILGRMGKAVMSFPGGCELGPRPIDLHLSSLRQLGVTIQEEGGNLICEVPECRGAQIHLNFPSVGATENVMLLAACGEGETVITNAAREPEIEDLQNFLNKIGGRVSGAGSSVIRIVGTKHFHPVEHRIIPDRIVAATLLSAAAVAGGDVTIRDMSPDHISTVLAVLSDTGCRLTLGNDWVRLVRENHLTAPKPVRTMPYPGFPTDAQAPIMAVCCLAKGTTIFVETIFESRYRHVGELLRMGADIKMEGRVGVVTGVDRLNGAHVKSTDLRGGAAVAVAALGAEGETVISDLRHIDRGYDSLETMLSSLGARAERREVREDFPVDN